MTPLAGPELRPLENDGRAMRIREEDAIDGRTIVRAHGCDQGEGVRRGERFVPLQRRERDVRVAQRRATREELPRRGFVVRAGHAHRDVPRLLRRRDREEPARLRLVREDDETEPLGPEYQPRVAARSVTRDPVRIDDDPSCRPVARSRSEHACERKAEPYEDDADNASPDRKRNYPRQQRDRGQKPFSPIEPASRSRDALDGAPERPP